MSLPGVGLHRPAGQGDRRRRRRGRRADPHRRRRASRLGDGRPAARRRGRRGPPPDRLAALVSGLLRRRRRRLGRRRARRDARPPARRAARAGLAVAFIEGSGHLDPACPAGERPGRRDVGPLAVGGARRRRRASRARRRTSGSARASPCSPASSTPCSDDQEAKASSPASAALCGASVAGDVVAVDRGEVGEDPVQREVVEAAALVDVLHVPVAGLVEGVHQGVVGAVEVERLGAEALAQLDVERRAQLEPPVPEQQLAVAVPGEQVGAHLGAELLAGQVVADVGEAEAGRDPARRAAAVSSTDFGTHQFDDEATTELARNAARSWSTS